MLPGLKAVFENFHEYRSPPQWIGLGYLTTVTSGPPPRTVRDVYDVAEHAAKMARHPRTFARFVHAIAFSLDDRIDNMSFEELSTMGQIHLGDVPSPFLLNPRILTAEDWQVFMKMDEYGLMPLPVTIAFGNLLAERVFEEKRACHLATIGQQSRAPIKGPHLDLSKICCEFIAAATNPLEAKKFISHAHELNSDIVIEANPDRAAFSDVIQMYDDMQDLVKDVWDETKVGMVTANALVADIDGNKGLAGWLEFCNQLDPKTQIPKSFIRLDRLPELTRESWAAMVEEATDIAGKISVPSAREGWSTIVRGLPGPVIPRAFGG